jgi:Zn-dependent M28 family amino/carboxypeptidase
MADQARLRGWVERLAVPRHARANASNNAWVRDELAGAFERLGLSVELQGPHQNVVALPRHGEGSPVTLVAAHYDTVPDCPGADDNASGLAIMLETARVLAGSHPRSLVGFLAFNGEEDGLLGSRDFVSNGLPTLRCRPEVTHVLEMVGFRNCTVPAVPLPLPGAPASLEVPDFIAFVAQAATNGLVDLATRSTVSPRLRLVGAKTWGAIHQVVPDLMRSDHFPFWDAGRPAVLWTDTGNFRNPHYHGSTDTPDTLDYAFMHEVAELLLAVVSLAGTDAVGRGAG